MRYKMLGNKVFPLIELFLQEGESIYLENGSMVYHNNELYLEGKMNSNGENVFGKVISAFGRSMTSGENFFITKATGMTNTAKIAIAPAVLGAVKELSIGSTQWRLNSGSFFACDSSVIYKMKRQKISQAFFGGTGGFFVMETAGNGTLLVNSYGDIVEVILDGSKSFVIDNQHVVAWTSSLDYQIKVGSGLLGITTGEGLVNEFQGEGTVLVQTRNLEGLANLLMPFINIED